MSGQCPPHLRKEKEIHKLFDNGFLDELLKLGGTSHEILKNKELLNIYLPILKADYALVETHNFSNFIKWNIDITVFHGMEDKEVNKEEALEWRNYTFKEFRFVEF